DDEGSPAAAPQRDSESTQRLLDVSVQTADNISANVARAWKLLAARRIANPQREGEVIISALDKTRLTLRWLEDTCGHQVRQGIIQVDLEPVVRARKRLDHEAGRFR